MARDDRTRVMRMSASGPSHHGRRGRGRPRGGDPAETRERILDAASTLFAESGFRGTSMVAVAQEAGLSQTGVAHHYASKEALLAAVLERRDELDLKEFELDPADGWAVLDQIAELIERNATRLGLVRLFTMLSAEAVDADHPGNEWLRSHNTEARTRLADALHQAIKDCRARPDTPVDSITRTVLALMDGLQVQWLLDPDTVDMAVDFREYVAGVRSRWELPG